MSFSYVALSTTDVVGHQTLLCPGCGNGFLHQQHVEVFDRHEDADVGMHATVEMGVTTVDVDQTENPSPRRDGIRIGFSCESCETTPSLVIIQHKGNTFVAWEK